VRTFVDYLVEMLDPESGKYITRECPTQFPAEQEQAEANAQAESL
jgi:hypothetical protein